jgi:peptidoglycan/LPS O-acetylase OafA/YrhL
MAIALWLVAVSFADVVIVHHAQLTSSWVYRSTDTRMGAFLVGGALAMAWAGPLAGSRRWAASTSAVASASVAVLVWAAWAFDHHVSAALGAVTWMGVSIAGPLLVVAVLDRRQAKATSAGPGRALSGSVLSGSVLSGSVLSGSLLRYLGRRSYALYLWHYVWLTWFRSFGPFAVVGALAASLVSAELSWRLVEAPCQARRRRFETVAEPLVTRLAGKPTPVLDLGVPVAGA